LQIKGEGLRAIRISGILLLHGAYLPIREGKA